MSKAIQSLFDKNIIAQQLGKFINDLDELTSGQQGMFARFTTEEKKIVSKTSQLIQTISENGKLSSDEMIQKIAKDESLLLLYMQNLMSFAKIVKSHQRTGGSNLRCVGKVETGRRRISRPK